MDFGSDGEALVVSHLFAWIPGQRAAQLLRQFERVFTDRGYYGRRVARSLDHFTDWLILARHFS